jgi:hypothetical protein
MRNIKLILGAVVLLLSSQVNASRVTLGLHDVFFDDGTMLLGTIDVESTTSMIIEGAMSTISGPDFPASGTYTELCDDSGWRCHDNNTSGQGAWLSFPPSNNDYSASGLYLVFASLFDFSPGASNPVGGYEMSDQFDFVDREDFENCRDNYPECYRRGIVSGYASAVPIPAAAWLFGTALIGLVGFGRRRKAA